MNSSEIVAIVSAVAAGLSAGAAVISANMACRADRREAERQRNNVTVRVRPVIDTHGIVRDFYMEAVNLGQRPVTITIFGFLLPPFKSDGQPIYEAFSYGLGNCIVDRLPYILAPGNPCRIQIRPAELITFNNNSLRPMVRLATGEVFTGAEIPDPHDWFRFDRRPFDGEDALIER